MAYTNLSSPTPVVAVFSTVKSGVCGIILSATAEFAATTLDGVHQSQKSLDTSLSCSSTLVIVVSPTSLTFVSVVTSVSFTVVSAFAITLLLFPLVTLPALFLLVSAVVALLSVL